MNLTYCLGNGLQYFEVELISIFRFTNITNVQGTCIYSHNKLDKIIQTSGYDDVAPKNPHLNYTKIWINSLMTWTWVSIKKKKTNEKCYQMDCLQMFFIYILINSSLLVDLRFVLGISTSLKGTKRLFQYSYIKIKANDFYVQWLWSIRFQELFKISFIMISRQDYSNYNAYFIIVTFEFFRKSFIVIFIFWLFIINI